MKKVLILVFLFPALAYAHNLTFCIQQLKNNCGNRTYSSAVLRCSWAIDRPACKAFYAVLFKYELKKLEDRQIAFCKELPDCNEYADSDYLLQRAGDFADIQNEMKKAGFSEEKLIQLIKTFQQ